MEATRGQYATHVQTCRVIVLYRDELRCFIIKILDSDEFISSTLPEADKLYDEVRLFKKHAGVSSITELL